MFSLARTCRDRMVGYQKPRYPTLSSDTCRCRARYSVRIMVRATADNARYVASYVIGCKDRVTRMTITRGTTDIGRAGHGAEGWMSPGEGRGTTVLQRGRAGHGAEGRTPTRLIRALESFNEAAPVMARKGGPRYC